MEKSKDSKDKERYKIVEEEIRNFSHLVDGHRELLIAIGKL